MDLRLQCPDYRYLLNENDKLIASIEGYRIDIPFCARKEKRLQFHHGILHTPSVEREIYMFNACDPSGDRRQTAFYSRL